MKTPTMSKRASPFKIDLLERHLRRGGSVTRGTALIDYKIHNLTATVSDLRRRGLPVVACPKTDGSGQPYTRWYMANA